MNQLVLKLLLINQNDHLAKSIRSLPLFEKLHFLEFKNPQEIRESELPEKQEIAAVLWVIGQEFEPVKLLEDKYSDMSQIVYHNSNDDFKISNSLYISLNAKEYVGDKLNFSLAANLNDRLSLLEEYWMLRTSFLEEAKEIIGDLEPIILSLEENKKNISIYNQIFRLVHTVKGASGVLERKEVTDFFHVFEDVITKIKESLHSVTSGTVDTLLKSFDKMREVVDLLLKNLDSKIVYEPILSTLKNFNFAIVETEKNDQDHNSSHHVEAKEESVVITKLIIDKLLREASELTIVRNALKSLTANIRRKLPRDEDLFSLENYLEEMSILNSSMQKELTNQRNVPVSNTMKRIPRMVRDLTKQLNKKANVEITGHNIRVDPQIANAISMSMTHLIRNSMDHGIELPDVRRSRGKNPTGTIKVAFSQDHEIIEVKIVDDGNGIDAERIKAKLIEKNMYTVEQIEKFSHSKILMQIFEPGFSTAAQVTDVSGRGVGMDMVRSEILKLGGTIDVSSEKGKGSIFKIKFPLPSSDSVCNALVVQISQNYFGIPQDQIDRLIILQEDQNKFIKRVNGKSFLCETEQLIPIICLRSFFYPKEEKSDAIKNLVIINIDQFKVAFSVDKILDIEDLVIKPFSHNIMKLYHIKSSTLMGDGSVGLIVDCKKIIEKVVGINFESLVEPEEILEEKVTNTYTEIMKVKLSNSVELGLILNDVLRIESVKREAINQSHKSILTSFRGNIVKILDLQNIIFNKHSLDHKDEQICIVVQRGDKHYFLLVDDILGIFRIEGELMERTINNLPFMKRSINFKGQIITMIDIDLLLDYSKTNNSVKYVAA